MSDPRMRGRGSRRGQALSAVLIGLAVFGALTLVAVTIQPNLIHGVLQRSQEDRLAHQNKDVLDAIASLISSSAEVLVIHQRGRSPFVEIVLRLRDERDSDFIRPAEIAVLSHSRVLQTVMLYTLNDDHQPPLSASAPTSGPGQPGTGFDSRGRNAGDRFTDMLLTREEVAAPEFCNQWRNDPAVSARIVATGVSDLRANFLHDRSINRAQMALGLTWTVASPDGEEQADLVLNVPTRISR